MWPVPWSGMCAVVRPCMLCNMIGDTACAIIMRTANTAFQGCHNRIACALTPWWLAQCTGVQGLWHNCTKGLAQLLHCTVSLPFELTLPINCTLRKPASTVWHPLPVPAARHIAWHVCNAFVRDMLALLIDLDSGTRWRAAPHGA